MVQIVNPRHIATGRVDSNLATRTGSLEGIRVGLFDNHKSGASALLDAVERGLRDRFDDISFIRERNPTATSKHLPELSRALAQRSGAVITAFGN